MSTIFVILYAANMLVIAEILEWKILATPDALVVYFDDAVYFKRFHAICQKVETDLTLWFL